MKVRCMDETHPLRAWRHEHGKTLTWVAEQVGCEPSFLSDVERGIKHPGLSLAVKLSELSGVPVGRFARDAENAA